MSNHSGKSWEKRILLDCASQRINIVKVPEDVKVIKGKVIRKKTQFDFYGDLDGVAFCFDAKAVTSSIEFNFKSLLLRQEKVHQWNSLKEYHDRGAIAGLMIYFARSRMMGWCSVPFIKELLTKDSSIHPDKHDFPYMDDRDTLNLRALMWDDRSVKLKELCGDDLCTNEN